MPSQKSKAAAKPAAKTPQRERGRARVAALLDAAAEVFARDGYEGATMTEVAKTAGASIGSLYQFFPTKPLIAEALYAREMEALGATLEAAAEGGPWRLDDLAKQLFAALIGYVWKHPALAIISDRRRADAKPRRGQPSNLRDQLAVLLAQARPKPPADEARRAAWLIHVLSKGASAAKVNEDPAYAMLMAELRAMLRARLSND